MFLGIVFLVWNLIVFCVYGADKLFAIRKMRRVPEKILIIFSFLMGGVGALFAMVTFKHKTRKLKFKICIPIAFLLTVFSLYIYMYKENMIAL